jgi:hypothetical protein
VTAGDEWRWGGAALLGAWHGLNPAMGWLFAVALGFQERSVAGVWRALGPLAAGHAAAIGAALLLAMALDAILPPQTIQWLVAAALVALGVYRLRRRRHPRGGGMRVGPAELGLWSFLMATAHGAGLMVVPLAIDGSVAGADHNHALGIGVTAVHTLTYLLVTGTIAALVYGRFGVRRLRELWVNLDLVWGMALVVTGVVTPLL